MNPMKINMIIYASLIPKQRLKLYKCLDCGRPLFKANSDTIVISNGLGPNHLDILPGSHYMEHQCHSCKTVYTVLFR